MQSYVEIPTDNTLQESLALILNNDKTALSSNSGTAFPTTNLQVGMLCYRSDEQKIYLLKNLDPTWILLFDLTNARVKFSNGLEAASGVDGGVTIADGLHQISSNDGDAHFNVRVGNRYNTTLGAVLASTAGFAGLQSYNKTTGVWSIYTSTASVATGDTPTFNGVNIGPAGVTFNGYTVWHAGNDGDSSGLDADMLDGQEGAYYAPIQEPNFVNGFSSTTANAFVKLGNKATTNSPFINFNSSGNDIDYDTRIAASGGGATLGEGTLTYYAAVNAFTGAGSFAGTLEANSLGVGVAASGVEGEIRATNNVTGYYSSDIRLKENIRPIDTPLEKVGALRGVYYDWKDDYIASRGGEDGYFIRKQDVGLIAQEVETVLPEIVATRPDGTKAIKYERVVALLVEAVKALSLRVAELESR